MSKIKSTSYPHGQENRQDNKSNNKVVVAVGGLEPPTTRLVANTSIPDWLRNCFQFEGVSPYIPPRALVFS